MTILCKNFVLGSQATKKPLSQNGHYRTTHPRTARIDQSKVKILYFEFGPIRASFWYLFIQVFQHQLHFDNQLYISTSLTDWLCFRANLGRRESWVGFPSASWLYRIERLSSHAGNLSTQWPVGTPCSPYQGCLGRND